MIKKLALAVMTSLIKNVLVLYTGSNLFGIHKRHRRQTSTNLLGIKDAVRPIDERVAEQFFRFWRMGS